MKIYLKKSITLILALVFCASFLYAEGLEKGKNQLKGKASGSPSYTFLNVNNISTWVYDNGNSDVTSSGDSGFVYPKGTGKTVFFESGPIWGGSMAGYYTIGGSAYRQGLTPGRVLESGVADNPENDNVRIYRVRSDYKNFTDAETMANLYSAEIDDEGMTAEQVYAQYELDWQQWPATWGAPFIDKDGDGIYNPDKDIPGVSEEPCQTVWWVANDLDASVTQYMYGGLPLKVEVQATFFAFNTTGPLGNTIFRKYKLINKNTIQFDSVYFCMWSDPDLGGAFDDYAGCDTLLSLGFVYNADSEDDIYATTPPASGFDFFQGPRVPGDASDSAKFLGRYVHGYKGLGMTSFFYFSQNVEADFSDPTQGSYAAVRQWRNMFEGKRSRTGSPYIDPNTQLATKFPLSGDPINKTGWIDGQLHTKNDRRFGQVSGPFTMNVGDTQEVVVGQLAAGGSPGVGALAAVSILKFYDKSAQGAYDNDFNVATPPDPPSVKVTELDASIILSWSDLASYQKTEAFKKSGFTFQGYNIYAFPASSSTIENAVRIATYDLNDGISTIVSPNVDATSGAVITTVAAYGTDSGIKRTIVISEDKVKGVAVLYTGSKYYFAVTAYAYNPDPNAVPNVLESTLSILTCTPQSTLPGVRYTASIDDAVTSVHTAGAGVGTLGVKVFDPAKVTGHNYEVRFENVALTDSTSAIEWFVKDITANKDVLLNQTIYGGVDALTGLTVGTNLSNADGLNFNVAGSTAVTQHYADVTFNGTSLPAGGTYWLGSGFTICEGAYWGNSGTTSYNASVSGLVGYGTLSSDTLKNDFELRFTGVAETQTVNGVPTQVITSGGSMATMWAASNYALKTFPLNPNFGVSSDPFLVRIPFEVWDVQNNKQITCLFKNRDGYSVARTDKDYPVVQAINTVSSAGGNLRNYIDILYQDYDATKVNSPYATDADSWLSKLTYFFGTYKMTWTTGDIIRFKIDDPLGTADSFTFTAPSTTTSATLAKEDVNSVNVFPNPYYGVNSQELNKYQRYVTFTHLPAKATIKIFNIAGQLVRTIEKDATGQFQRWDLASDSGLPVASGIYVAYIDMPEQGVVKQLKVAIIQEQQYLDRF